MLLIQCRAIVLLHSVVIIGHQAISTNGILVVDCRLFALGTHLGDYQWAGYRVSFLTDSNTLATESLLR